MGWLAPRSGLRWIDIGCGNGAFTELLVERCALAEVPGIDPSEGQLAYARARPAARVAIGKNRIMIYGPKDDGTYVVEFRDEAEKGGVRHPNMAPTNYQTAALALNSL